MQSFRYNLKITGYEFNLIKSFMTDRTQHVIIDSINSEPFWIEYTVPRGSVLGL